MAELRQCVAGLGFTEVRTLLQSGNVMFHGLDDGRAGEVEHRLEAEIEHRFGLRADVLLRDAAQWRRSIAANPFPADAEADPAHLLLMPLKAAPSPGAIAALKAAIQGPERVHVDGTEAYLVYPAGVGRSKLTPAVIERKLQTRGTARNWNTVQKLAALL